MRATTRLSRPPRYRSACLALAVFVAGAAVARAETETFEPLKDNTLYETTDGSLSNGAGDHLFAGTTAQNDVRRAVLTFDVATAIPAGSTVTSVTLTMNMSRTIAGDEVVALHRLLGDWGEAGSDAGGQEGGGAPSQSGDATWIHTFFDTDSWGSAGGDFAATQSASTTVGGTGSYTWGSTPDMVADVQGWVDDPSQNFGWILIGDESVPQTAKRFDSKDHPTASVRPTLTVEFDPPAAGSGRVPDGDDVPGQQLVVTKESNGEISLDWAASCLGSDNDYEVYEGDLRTRDSHTELFCSTGGATTITFAPSIGQRYYLIVPTDGVDEGSYGADRTGAERPICMTSCLPQQIAACQ